MSSHLAKEENGFVMVWAAICMMTLLTFAGLAVDVGNWHLQGGKLQRAADAAAMAGVTRLPNDAAAKAAALDALAKNGIVPSADVQVDFAFPQGKRMQVKVTNRAVPTLFASFVVKNIQIGRQATAEHRSSIKMGNPFNYLGTGTRNQTMYRDIRYEGYWLAINGYCTAAEDGDMSSSRFDGNKGANDGSFPTVCDGSRGEYNPYYKPITATDGGHNFLITIPAGAPLSKLEIIDPAFSPNGLDDNGRDYSPDRSLNQPADQPASFPTNYRLFETSAVTPDDYSDDTLVYSQMFYGGESVSDTYDVPYNLSPGNTYRLNVTTPDDGSGRSLGINTFGLGVIPASDDYWRRYFTEAWEWVCDSRFETRCPTIGALDALSVQMVGKGSKSAMFITSLDPSYAGDAIQVGLFDAGESGHNLKLIRPDLRCQPFSWHTPAKLGAPSMVGEATSEDCTSDASALDVSGTSFKLPGRQSAAKFNDRLVNLNFRVPNNYPSVVAAANNTTWWKVEYESVDLGKVPQDRTTWSVTLVDGGPVRLIPN